MGEVMAELPYPPQGWFTEGTWATESQSEAIARTPLPGRRFFRLLFASHPELQLVVHFRRWSFQDSDTYAFFEYSGGVFGVQYDPLLEYIIISCPKGHNEVGEWFDDPAQEAVRYIEEAYYPGPSVSPK